MTRPIYYTCQAELLPILEGALAAHAYQVEVPLQDDLSRTRSMLLSYGASTVLISHSPKSPVITIEVTGLAQTATVELLDSMPIPLTKHPPRNEIAY
jgi:hypothetical protein